MKNIFINIFISLLIFISIVLIIIQIKVLQNKLNKLQKDVLYKNQDISFLKKDLEETTNTFLHYLTIDNEKIMNIKVKRKYLIREPKSNKSTKERNLADIIKERKIVFRFFQASCNSCVSEQLNKLLALSKKIGANNIILLPDYINDNVSWFLIHTGVISKSSKLIILT